MRFGIRQKLFVLIAGLTAVVLLGVLVSITKKMTEAIQQKVKFDFEQRQRVFQREQALKYNLLETQAVLIGENATFKGNVQVNDPSTVYYIVDEFSTFALYDLFIVTDKDGKVLARFGEPERYGDDMTSRSNIQRALRGAYREEKKIAESWPELWTVDGQLFQVATVPIYLHSVIGTIAMGSTIGAFEAEELKGDTQIEITFMVGDSLIASTDTLLSGRSINTFYSEQRARIDAVLQQTKASEVFESVFDGKEIYAFIGPLGTGEPAYYIAHVPKADKLKIVDELTATIKFTAALSAIFIILLAMVLGRTLTAPILRLVAGMGRVLEGDLQVEVKPTTRDEVGLLTRTFNEMVVGLRERLHLTRYVGTHTLDMIQATSNSDAVDLGGTRRELAVLFSDIRGFTSYSVDRDPEEVISMVNRYLGFQAKIVPQYEGSIDKFVGDQMVALFIDEHALERAIECAIAIQRRIRREHETDPLPIHIGIGINYGPVILGNMGAENRLDYTVIGAAVNLGSRLCSEAKGGEILIRRELLETLDMDVDVLSTAMMAFKGVAAELEIAAISSAE